MNALFAAMMIVSFGFAAYTVIVWIVVAFQCLETWIAVPQPRKEPPAPAMSDKAFFMIAYGVVLLAAFSVRFTEAGEIQPPPAGKVGFVSRRQMATMVQTARRR